MSKVKFIYLNQREVIECGGLDMVKTIEDVELVFKLHNEGKTILPAKVALRWGDIHSEETRGRINAMPGYVGDKIDIAGIKWIASAPQNPFKYGLPRASAIIILNDPYKGIPVCIMDGTVISAMRTGAVTGVAVKYLARKDSEVVGLIGAGTQNKTQLMALKTVLKELKEIKVYDLIQERSEKFAEEAYEEMQIDVVAVNSAEEAVRGSDVVVTATTSSTPLVKSKWVEKGMLIVNVGGYESEFDVLKKADKIVVDDWYQVKHRATQTTAIMFNEGELKDDDIYANLGAIVSGDKPGRERDEELIFFNPVGMAAEDIIVAHRIFQTAKKEGKGVALELWNIPQWV